MPPSISSDRLQHLLALVLAIWFAFLSLAYHRSFPPGTIPAHAFVIAVACLLLAAAAGLGARPARRLLGEGSGSAAVFLVGLGLGLGLMETAMLVLLSLGLANAVTGWLLVTAGLLSGARLVAARVESIWVISPERPSTIRAGIRERWWGWPVVALSGAGWIGALGAALAPAEFYDALIYHLAIPDRYLAAGEVSAQPGIFYAHFPAGQGMLYALGMLVTTDRIEAGTLAQVLHLLLGAAAVVATFVAGRRHLSPGAGLLGAALLATVPGVLLVATWPIADLAATLFGALTLMAILEIRSADMAGDAGAGRAHLVVLAGLLAGLALGVKYTAAVSVVAPAAAWMLLRARRLEPARLVEAALFAGAVAAAILPWAARNVALTGNPVAPYLSTLFGSPDTGPGLGDELAKRLPDEGGAAAVAMHVLSGPVRMGLEPMGAGGYLGVSFILLIPFIFLGRTRPAAVTPLAVVAVTAVIGWTATVQVSRYLFPALPAIVLLAAQGGAALLRAAPMVRAPLAACLGWLLMHNLYIFGVLALTINPYGVAFGVEMPADYLARRVSYYPAAAFINAQLPDTARILMLGEGRGYYIERDYAAGSAYDRMPVDRPARRAIDEGRALAEILREEGFTHLLVSRPEMSRIARMHGKRDYLELLEPAAREEVARLLGGAASRTLFERSGVSVMEIPGP